MRFKTIYADPPWHFNDQLKQGGFLPYKTMTLADIKKLPVNDVAELDAHLYLWVPSALLKEGLEVMESWGFKYKCHIVWVKRTVHGKLSFGLGRYFRHCNELLLFGVKGRLFLKTRNTRNLIDAKKTKRHHSAKPDEMYELIEKNSYSPFLELFATKKRKNWTTWGYEINKRDIMDEFDREINLNTMSNLYREK